MKSQLETILEKLEIIQTVVFSLKDSYEEEVKPSSPILISEIEGDASFKCIGSSSPKEEHKQLTLKHLAAEVPNHTFARIAEVLQIVVNKIELVKTQSSTLEDEIKKSIIARVPSLKVIGGEESSSANIDPSQAQMPSEGEPSTGPAYQSAWEK